MAYLARMLADDGYEVRSWCLDGAPNEGTPSEATSAERIVLPVPLQREGRLNGTRLPLGELWPRLNPAQRTYAGAVSAEDHERAEQMGLRIVDYFTDEALTVQNAVPTAEGALAAAMEHMSVTLHGAPCAAGRAGQRQRAAL